MEEFQAGLITPMNIFNDEQHGLLPGLPDEELCEGSEEAAFLLFWIGRGRERLIRWKRHKIREQWRHFTRKRCYSGGARCREYAGCIRAQEIEEWSVRAGEISREAIALQEQEVMGRGVGFRLGHQPRFANACLTAEQGHMPSPAFCLINELVEGGQIGCAPD